MRTKRAPIQFVEFPDRSGTMYYYQPTKKNIASLSQGYLGPFELFKLPIEIRKMIYDMVAAEETK